MILSVEQEKVLSSFCDFRENDHDVFILTGAAGTGKSVLLVEILNEISKEALVLGTTGRSVKVLRDKGIPAAENIHRAIYGAPKISQVENESDEVSQLYKTVFSLRKIGDYLKYIIVDEVSMLSDAQSNDQFLMFGTGRVLKDLLTFAKGNTHHVKLIFVGDNYQLPPVGDNSSKAFDVEYLDSQYGLKCEHHRLIDIHRQSNDSGILANAMNVRKLISTERSQRGSFEFSFINTDVAEITQADVIDRDSKYLEDVKDSVVITYENKRAFNYNQKIRAHIFGQRVGIRASDKLVIAKNIYRDMYPCPVINGDFVVVKSVRERKEQQVFLNGQNYKLFFRDVTLRFDSFDKEFDCYIYEKFLYDEKSSIDPLENQLLYIDCQNRMSKEKNNWPLYAKYLDALKAYETNAKIYKQEIKHWQKYQSDRLNTKKSVDEFLRNKYQFGKKYKPTLEKFGVNDLIREFQTRDPYLNAIVAKFGYAITGHKSQGGEWDTVFVDYADKAQNDDDSLRWVYTATTRAKKHLYVINPPKVSGFEKVTVTTTQKLPSEARYRYESYRPTTPLFITIFKKIQELQQACGFELKKVIERKNHYFVVYIIDTDFKGTQIQFYFNKKGLSKIVPKSFGGEKDKKLELILDSFKQ